jgi:hypothetical protein
LKAARTLKKAMSRTSTESSSRHTQAAEIAAATEVEIVVVAADVQAVVEVDGIVGVVMAAEVVAVGTAAVAGGTKDFLEAKAATLLRLFPSNS